MKQLATAASALVVALLLMMSFNASAVEGSQKRRAKAPRINYSQFSHRTHVNAEKPACESCHKFPTDNWKNVRAGDVAFPDIAEFPEHASCLNCHRQQFFARQRPAPAICVNCHVNVTPRETARFLFPSLGDVTNTSARKKTNVTEFAINFPHDKHEDQECTVCHQMDKEGDIKTKPNSHTVCFTCHNVESEVAPLPSSCNACHKLGEPDEKSDPVATAPGTDLIQVRLGQRQYNHAGGSAALGGGQYRPAVAGGSKSVIVDQGMKVPDNADYSKFQHDSAYHQRLPCLLCHRRDSNSPQPTMPGAKDHLPCAGCHVKQFADRSSAICTNCHTEPSSGKLKPFPALTSFNMKFDHARHTGVACSNCHRPARAGVALTIPAGSNAHVTCFQCHGPQAKSGDRDISSCSVCHQLGPYTRTSQTARAFRVGFSHAAHNRDERLNCNDCHRIRSDDVAAPQPLNHHAARGSFSCMSCHNGKRAFGGDDFSACKRCHQGSAWHF